MEYICNESSEVAPRVLLDSSVARWERSGIAKVLVRASEEELEMLVGRARNLLI